MNILPSRLTDIDPVFNLVLSGSSDGVFSDLYKQPRYLAGLAQQLFSCIFLKRIQIADGTWHNTKMYSAYIDSDFAGFIIIRDIGKSECREIYLFAVSPRFRQMGVGRELIDYCRMQMLPGESLEASCLPKAKIMKHLLKASGFTSEKKPNSDTPKAQRWVFR